MKIQTALAFACCSALLVSASMGQAAEKKKSARASHEAPTPKKRPMIDEADENMSGQGYGMAGCGLGSIVFGEKKGMIQIVAATLNGTGVQTFGISTGTSNCKTTSHDSAKNASLFIVVNREILAKDIARGNGEALNSLTAIMGCSDSALLGTKLRQNFDRIFPAANASAEESSQKIFNMIKGDGTLAKSCPNVG